MNEKLDMRQQHVFATWMANSTLSCIKRGIASRDREVVAPLYSVPVRPHLENGIQAWGSQDMKSIELLEWVQRRTTKMIPGFQHFPYMDRLRELGLISMEKVPGGPYSGLPVLDGGLQESWGGTFYKSG